MRATAPTVSGYGSAVAPAAGAAIVTIAAASLLAGRWSINVEIGYGGTAGLIDDMELRRGAAAVARCLLVPVVNTNGNSFAEFILTLDGLTTLSINAVTGGVAGSVYRAKISATPIVGE